MARLPNATALAELQTKLGREPIIIVEASWSTTLPTSSYADKTFLTIPGKILAISDVDAIVKVSSGGASQAIEITLDDTDGSIKTIMDTHDIYKRPVSIYQAFEGLALTDKFLLFSGVIATPLKWAEGDRQLSFSVESNIEDQEVGFAPEKGEFEFISDQAVGKAWPLCFGSPLRVPAAKITDRVRGTSLTRYGLITRDDLLSLCERSGTVATAQVAKNALDLIAGAAETNVQTSFENLNQATISLNIFLEGLIFDSPTQEDDLREYAAICYGLAISTYQFDTNTVLFQAADQDVTAGETAVQLAIITYNNALLAMPTVPAVIAAALAALLLAQDDLADAQQRKALAETQILDAAEEIADFNLLKDNLTESLAQIVITEIIVDGGEDFPQATPVNVIINGAKFNGTFAGEVFTVLDPDLALYMDIQLGPRQNDNSNELWITDSSIILKGQYLYFNNAVVHVDNQDETRIFFSPLVYSLSGSILLGSFYRKLYDIRLFDEDDSIAETSSILMNRWVEHLEYLDSVHLIPGEGLPDYASGLTLTNNQDYTIEIGDDIYLEGDYKDIYIANLIPSTSISEVLAFRTIDGVRKLLPIPTNYYIIDLNESIANQNATTVRLKRPLTQYSDENWEEQIYVSLTSTVGPNTAEVIKYVVDDWLNLSSDATSFSAVTTALGAYPSHFALLDLREGLELIEDIAFQARCAVYIKESTVYIKYLAAEESAVLALTESEVSFGSFNIEYTEVEKLVTELTAIWQDDYVQIDDDEEPNKVVLRNNIPKYGLFEQEFNFTIYNIRSLVVKSATFWMIRFSNVWKILNCSVSLDTLEVETFDQVDLTFANNLIASGTVKGVVLSAAYNSDDQSIGLKIQSPVQSGQLTAHSLFYPATAGAGVEYPTSFDPYAGGA